jgi:hypothetical protein
LGRCSAGRAVGRCHVPQHLLRLDQYPSNTVLTGDRRVSERHRSGAAVGVVAELPRLTKVAEAIEDRLHFLDLLLAAGGGALGDVGLHPQVPGGDGSVEPVLLLLHRGLSMTHGTATRHVLSAVPSDSPPVLCSVARYAALAV